MTSSLQPISSPVPAVDIQNLMLVTVFFNSILYNLNFRFVCVCVLFGCLEKLNEKREMRDNLLVWIEGEIWVFLKIKLIFFSWFIGFFILFLLMDTELVALKLVFYSMDYRLSFFLFLFDLVSWVLVGLDFNSWDFICYLFKIVLFGILG